MTRARPGRVAGWRAAALLVVTLLATGNATAVTEVAQGSAQIEHGDLAAAREVAIRRAVATAARRHGARVAGQTQSSPGRLVDTAQLRTTACTGAIEVLESDVRDGMVEVAVRVEVGPQFCTGQCQRPTRNKLVVTGFALEHAAQLRSGELASLPRATALELARRLDRRPSLLAVADPERFLYRTPASAPELFMPATRTEPGPVEAARLLRAQYVLSGVYRDFSLRDWERAMELEVFLHDGTDGTVLASHRFIADVITPFDTFEGTHSLRSAPFANTALGETWSALLEHVAAWAMDRAGCLPFVARVIRRDGDDLYIDAGARAGLSAGDTLMAQRWRDDAPVVSGAGIVLGRERRALPPFAVRAVYPEFAIVRVTELPEGAEPPVIRPGDLLYAP